MRRFFRALAAPLAVTLLLTLLAWAGILFQQSGRVGQIANLLMFAVFVWAGWAQVARAGHKRRLAALAALPPFVLWHLLYTTALHLYSGRTDDANRMVVFILLMSFLPALLGLLGGWLGGWLGSDRARRPSAVSPAPAPARPDADKPPRPR